MDVLSPKPFKEAALRAFPPVASTLSRDAARELLPFVDDSYRQRSISVVVRGQPLVIPSRLSFKGLSASGQETDDFNPASLCLISRATDGYLRQRALRSIIFRQEAWIAPFVIILLGEYIVEIVEDIWDGLEYLDRPVYSNFVLENRRVMQALRARATSYWDAHYRHRYPEKRKYPALEALHQLEVWAA